MIYTVECTFSNPSEETVWNDFYSLEKLPALISVSGFCTSQRFKALTPGCPVYLAIHTIAGVEVLSSNNYRENGGGNFARWQQFITDWHRNVYEGIEVAPSVGEREYLLLCGSGSEPLQQLGFASHKLHAMALEKNPEFRWLSTTQDIKIEAIKNKLPVGVYLYEPIGEQLISE